MKLRRKLDEQCAVGSSETIKNLSYYTISTVEAGTLSSALVVPKPCGLFLYFYLNNPGFLWKFIGLKETT